MSFFHTVAPLSFSCSHRPLHSLKQFQAIRIVIDKTLKELLACLFSHQPSKYSNLNPSAYAI